MFIFAALPVRADLPETLAKACARWLEPQKTPAPILPSKSPDYLEFQQRLSEDPSALPPAAPFSKEATPAELKFSFYFWWYPGNVFGPLMVPHHRALTQHLLTGGKMADHLIPSAEERAIEAAHRAEHPVMEIQIATKSPAGAQALPSSAPESVSDPLDTSPTKEDAASAPPAAAPVSNDPTGSFGGDTPSNF